MSATHRLKPLAFGLLLACTGAAGAADLMQAYELARVSDPQLGIAEANQFAVREGVAQSRSALLPQISGTAGLNDTAQDTIGIGEIRNPDGSIRIGPVTNESDPRSRSYSIDVQQSLYNHANYTRLRASRARAGRAEFEYELAADTLKLRVSEAYFRVLTAIDTLAFAYAERRAVKRQLDQADQRFEVGLTAITDVHEARARYDGARANAIAAANALDDAREALGEITGQQMTNLRGLGDQFKPQLPTPAEAEAWVEQAIANNPSLKAREQNLLAAGHDIATARAGHLPTLGGSVRFGDTGTWGNGGSNGVNFPISSSGDSRVIGLQLTVPIFAGGLTQSQVRQALYTRDLVQDQLEQERRSVIRQTRTNFRSVEAGLAEIGAREQALVSARSALEATEAGFEVGTRTIVDVLLSQQQLFQAQRNYSESRHNFLVNGLRLRQAAGTIDVKDLQEVNRHLVSDAEAKLAEGAEDEAG